MTELKNKMDELFAACWRDEGLKARLLSDPRSVLAEHGMPVPDDVKVNVVENGDDRVHITIPAAPAGHHHLSDEALSQVAGGTCSAWMWTSFMGTSKACPDGWDEGMPGT